MSKDIIAYSEGSIKTPDFPAIPYIVGDGIGPECWAAARPILDAAVKSCYGDSRKIEWFELPASGAAITRGLELLPPTTIDAIRTHRVAIKGPTMTPIGGGHRSINVQLRQTLDLYANVRPVMYFEGVDSPLKAPGELNVVIFRENTEDVYAGIEFASGSSGAFQLAGLLHSNGYYIPPDSGIGIKIISRVKTRKIVKAAIEFALQNNRRRVTIVHKGNIMKDTEGAFRAWGFELVREEYSGRAIAASDLKPGESPPEGVVLVDDRLADAMFQDVILNPGRVDVIVTSNLNGDYLSDACAAQVGGLGLAPGANIGDGIALFEATHGTAPDIAGKGIANPGSIILSGSMLLDYIGWREAGAKVKEALSLVLKSGRMTADLAAKRPGVEVLSTESFGRAVAQEAGK